MTADVQIKDDDAKYYPPHPQSPLSSKFCEVTNESEDSRLLCQDCMCHFCNKYCLHNNRKNKPRTHNKGFGHECNFMYQDTPGMPHLEQPAILVNKKGIKHFRMTRLHSKRAVQHSRTLLKGWHANCNIKLLLYFSNPNCPDIGEIEDVCGYVVAYTGKQHHTSRNEKETIQSPIIG